MVKSIGPRMYVVTRKDFDPVYRSVQGAHALAQYALEHPEELRTWNNEYLIYLGVFLEANLDRLYNKLLDKGYKLSKFHEPDQRDQLTAIAIFEDGSGRVANELKGIPLA